MLQYVSIHLDPKIQHKSYKLPITDQDSRGQEEAGSMQRTSELFTHQDSR